MNLIKILLKNCMLSCLLIGQNLPVEKVDKGNLVDDVGDSDEFDAADDNVAADDVVESADDVHYSGTDDMFDDDSFSPDDTDDPDNCVAGTNPGTHPCHTGNSTRKKINRKHINHPPMDVPVTRHWTFRNRPESRPDDDDVSQVFYPRIFLLDSLERRFIDLLPRKNSLR